MYTLKEREKQENRKFQFFENCKIVETVKYI